MYHDWGFVWKLNDVEEVCKMVSEVASKTFRREKPADWKFISEGGFFSITRVSNQRSELHRRTGVAKMS